MDQDDILPIDRYDMEQLQSIADWLRDFPNDDYHADALFIEDIISKVAPLVREVERLNMEIKKQRNIYHDLLAGFDQLKQEREL